MRKRLLFSMLMAVATTFNVLADETIPDTTDYLFLVALDGNDTVQLNQCGSDRSELTAQIEYSLDNRQTWMNYAWNSENGFGDTIALEMNDTIYFRAGGTGLNATFSNEAYYRFEFGTDDSIAAGGNVMSLYDATCKQDTMTIGGFKGLFENCKALISIPNLPATQLAENCYQNMFSGCSSLSVDTLGASCNGTMLSFPTTGATNWDMNMFTGCHIYDTVQLGRDYCISQWKGLRKLSYTIRGAETTFDRRTYYSMFHVNKKAKIAYSCDGGETWTQVPQEDDSIGIGRVDACYDSVIYKASRAEYLDILDTAYIIIHPRQLIFTSGSAEKKYDGIPISNPTVQVSGDSLLAGDSLLFWNFPRLTNADTIPNTFDVQLAPDVKTINYAFADTIYGNLIVTPRIIQLSTNSACKLYDGTPLTRPEVTLSGDGFLDGEGVQLNVTGSQTEIGASPNTITYTWVEGTTPTNYIITLNEGTLTVVGYSTCNEANWVTKGLLVFITEFTVAYTDGAFTYIQDSTGGALIWADNYGLRPGDVVRGFYGMSSPTEGGLPRMIPQLEAWELTISSGAAPLPTLMQQAPTVEQINQYIKYENVTVLDKQIIPSIPVQAILLNGDTVVLNSQLGRSFVLEEDESTYDITATVGVANGVVELYPILISTHCETKLPSLFDNTVQRVEKFIINGQMFIRVNGVLYNYAGIRIL